MSHCSGTATRPLALSVVGGLVCSALGIAGSAVFAASTGAWAFAVMSYAVPLGVGVTTFVGIFFGIYPASIAAKIRTAVALHSS